MTIQKAIDNTEKADMKIAAKVIADLRHGRIESATLHVSNTGKLMVLVTKYEQYNSDNE